MARANIIIITANRSMGWIIMTIMIMVMIIMMNNLNIWMWENKNSRIIIDLVKDLWWMKRMNSNGEINNSNLV